MTGRAFQSWSALFLLFVLGFVQAVVAAPAEPSPEKLLASLGLDTEASERVLAGETVTVDLARSLPNELAVGAAFLVDAPPDAVLHALRSARRQDADPDVLRHGRIDLDRMELDGFPEPPIDRDLAGELHALLRLKPGSRYNFSSAEAKELRATSKQSRLGRSQRHPAVAADMLASWKDILRERCRAFHAQGLAGVDSYDRGGDEDSQPSSELASALRAEAPLLRWLPLLRDDLETAPSQSGAQLGQDFRWLQQSVQGRVQFALVQAASLRGDELHGFLERQFFVGHTYNSLQTLTLCLPVGERTLVVHSNRTFTDAIVGLAESIAQRVGQRRLRAEVLDDSERLRSVLVTLPTETVTNRPPSLEELSSSSQQARSEARLH